MKNKSTSWIEVGIKSLAKNGKIEINTVCREKGTSKSSFYNIYPNDGNSRGVERYLEDLLKHHQSVLIDYFKQTRKLYIIYNIPEIIEEHVQKIEEYYDYHACSAHFRKMAQTNNRIKEHWDYLYSEYVSLINDFYKINNLPESDSLNDQELRLLLDSVLTFNNKEFIADARNIITSRLQLRREK